ncbi:unnamed protein product, partial [marine sediment metagenome]
RIWTDHRNTYLIARYISPIYIGILAAILGYAVGGGLATPILFSVAAFIVADFTRSQVMNKDRGYGVRWDCYDSWVYTPPTIITSIALYSQ